jgi:NitT/TauT family transport system substrate-binding protein
VLAISICSRGNAGDKPLRLGYFPNITHAQAIVGVQEGTFERELHGGALKTRLFNAGPDAMDALLAGEVDVAYVGPGPAISAYVNSGGRMRVISGVASGGAGLVVKGLKNVADLAHQMVAVPQIKNTQDIALRRWLAEQRLEVTVIPLHNAEIVKGFKQGFLKAAWVPEPWLSTLVSEGGTLLIDERTLWPAGRFPTTVLVASEEALKNRREDVKSILRAHLELTFRARMDRKAFIAATNEGFYTLTGKRLDGRVIADAFSRLELLADPMADKLTVVAERAEQLGYVPNVNIAGIVDSTLLDELTAQRGMEGLGGSGSPAPSK